jgi:tetratricopeptide (TPR) repeat protein
VQERLHRDADVERLLAGLDPGTPLGALLDETQAPSALAALWVLDAAGALSWRDAPPPPSWQEQGAVEFEFVQGEEHPGAVSQPEPVADALARAGVPHDAAALALRAEIQATHANLDQLDHYALLGVAADAGRDAIRRAYVAAAKRFHPDALVRLGLGDLRGIAQQLFARVAQAHEVLTDPERRREYDAEQRGESGADAAQVVQAEALYRKGEVLLRAGNFAGALEFLAPAVALWPEEAAYQSALGWALYKRVPSDPGGARAHLARAVGLAPDDPVTHFRLGLVLRALGETAAAESELAAARHLDPAVR